MERANVVSKSFSDVLGTMMKTLMESRSFSDVTLVCDNHVKIRAHKLVLSSTSSLFEEIFKDDLALSEIHIIGIKGSEMESILQFIYLGKVDIPQGNLCSFISTAKNLEFNEIVKTVKEAREEIVKSFKSNTTPTSSTKTEKITELYLKEEVDPINQKDVIQPNKGRKIDCDECGAKLLNSEGLQKHKKYQHSGKFYPCDQCDYKAKQPGGLKTHKIIIHEGIRLHQCNECDFKGSTKQQVKIHTTVKHGIGKLQYCSLCDFSTATKNRLKIHIEGVHQKLYLKCNFCEYKITVSSHKSSLTDHIRSVHEGVKYPCHQCEYVGKTLRSFKKHEKNKHSKI